VVELYRTTITTLEGILWLLLLFSLVVFAAYWIMRKARLKEQQVSQPKFNNSNSSAD
jgi:cbb3-type cytochrome oxidase subunit 3